MRSAQREFEERIDIEIRLATTIKLLLKAGEAHNG